tara:strand:+ start:972 stop:1166 length:195 start_codon:yes stop_codon:yes gene_type:complete
MSRKINLTPHEQFAHEVRALLHRYLEESDLDDYTLAEIMEHALGQWMNEDVVDFSSDIDLEDDG